MTSETSVLLLEDGDGDRMFIVMRETLDYAIGIEMCPSTVEVVTGRDSSPEESSNISNTAFDRQDGNKDTGILEGDGCHPADGPTTPIHRKPIVQVSENDGAVRSDVSDGGETNFGVNLEEDENHAAESHAIDPSNPGVPVVYSPQAVGTRILEASQGEKILPGAGPDAKVMDLYDGLFLTVHKRQLHCEGNSTDARGIAKEGPEDPEYQTSVKRVKLNPQEKKERHRRNNRAD
ncbi:hypothetical protein B0H13DRAFT_1855087 [Mycena leptocephala]|nr:hypothetical protein B0H13DRAFT_1855087 [Mycena leptocephala]